MQCVLNQAVVLALILTCFIVWTSAEGLSCNSCGEECADACGTRFFRTCCFNYLRKRSSPPIPQQTLGADFDESSIWLNRAEIEKLIRNELLRQQSINRLEQKPPQQKDDFHKSSPASNANQIGLANSHEQMRVIYDI